MQPATGSFRIFRIALTNISLGLLGGEKLWAGDVVLAAPLIARQITIQVFRICQALIGMGSLELQILVQACFC